MNAGITTRIKTLVAVGAVAVALEAIIGCGGGSTGATTSPSPMPPPSRFLLTVSDFGAGSVDETGSGSQPLACMPSTTSGPERSAVIRVTDGTGFNWTNMVTSYDTASDAQAFATAFLNAAKQCASGSGAATANLGNYSFTYAQSGYGSGFGAATVEVARVRSLLTVVVDGPNIAQNPPSARLDQLAQTSVTKLAG